VPISRENPFLTCKAVARYLCVSYGLSCRPMFLARDSMHNNKHTIARPSVCLSHGWISQTRL